MTILFAANFNVLPSSSGSGVVVVIPSSGFTMKLTLIVAVNPVVASVTSNDIG